MKIDWPTNDTRGIGSLQKLRKQGMAQTIPSQEIDDWLKQSIALVAGCVKGLGTNQRRVRYFGFETAHGNNPQTKQKG
jgi:hypothetical protein